MIISLGGNFGGASTKIYLISKENLDIYRVEEENLHTNERIEQFFLDPKWLFDCYFFMCKMDMKDPEYMIN